MKYLDVWYARLNVDDLMKIVEQADSEKVVGRMKKTVDKAETKTNLGALTRYAEQVDGKWQIKPDPPVVERLPLEQLPLAQAVIDQGWHD